MLKTSYQKLARLFYAVFTIVHGHTLAITLSEKMYAQREEMKVSMSVEDFLYITKQERTGRDSAKFNSLNLIFNECCLSWTCFRLFKSSQRHLLEMFGRFCGSPPNSEYPGYQRFFLACDEDLRRPQADTSSAEGRRQERRRREKNRGWLFETWPKPETAHEKSLTPRVHSGRRMINREN